MSVLEDNGTMQPHQTAVKPDRSVPPHEHRKRKAATFAVLAVLVLALGAAAGAGAMKLTRPSLELAPMTPVAISAMTDRALVTEARWRKFSATSLSFRTIAAAHWSKPALRVATENWWPPTRQSAFKADLRMASSRRATSSAKMAASKRSARPAARRIGVDRWKRCCGM